MFCYSKIHINSIAPITYTLWFHAPLIAAEIADVSRLILCKTCPVTNNMILTHWGQVTKPSGTKPLSEPMLAYSWLDHKDLREISIKIHQENKFEDVAWKMAAILSWPQCFLKGFVVACAFRRVLPHKVECPFLPDDQLAGDSKA